MKTANSVTPIKSDDKEVACDGGGGTLGHPKIYLPFGNDVSVECYYCGKRFEKNLIKKQPDS